METKKNSTFSNVFWAYGERITAQLITFVVSVVLSRILMPESYGVVAIVVVFIAICDALVTGGFGNALIQKKDSNDMDFDSICWLSITIAVLLYIVLFFSAPLIADFYCYNQLIPVIRVMGIRLIFSAFNSVQQAYVQKKMIFRVFFWATLSGTIISGIVGISIALLGGGVWALVAQYMTNTVIDTIMLYIFIDWTPKFRISIDSIRKLWKFGAKMLAATMVFTLKDNIRSLVIGRRFSASDLAYYNQGKRYPSLMVDNVVESLGKVLFPVLSEEQNTVESLKGHVRQSIQISSILLTPMIMGIIAVADTMVNVILTDKWMPCVPYLRILCLVYITRSINTILQKAVLAIGKSGAFLFHEVITSTLTVLMIFVAAYIFKSIEMIAWSYVVIMMLGTIIFAFFSKKYFKYRYFEIIADYFPSLIVSCVMALVVWGIGRIAIMTSIKLLIQIIVGVIIYVCGVAVLDIPGYRFVRDKAIKILLKQ